MWGQQRHRSACPVMPYKSFHYRICRQQSHEQPAQSCHKKVFIIPYSENKSPGRPDEPWHNKMTYHISGQQTPDKPAQSCHKRVSIIAYVEDKGTDQPAHPKQKKVSFIKDVDNKGPFLPVQPWYKKVSIIAYVGNKGPDCLAEPKESVFYRICGQQWPISDCPVLP